MRLGQEEGKILHLIIIIEYIYNIINILLK